jgi:hypothetical protein
MKKIPLTGGRFAIVDDVDYENLSQFKWHIDRNQTTCYAHRTPWVHGQNRSQTIRMHRQIMGFPSGLVDHRNGNGLDNRRTNLRVATKSENHANSRKLDPRNKSGYRGVFRIRTGRWMAQIRAHGKPKYLGLFDTAEQANDAYRSHAQSFRGFRTVMHCVKTAFPTLTAAALYIQRTNKNLKKRGGIERVPALCPKCKWYHISYPQGMGHSNTRTKEAVH